MRANNRPLANARQIFNKRGGMLRTSDALRLGVHPRTLYSLRDSGEIEQVSRGLYRLSNAPPLSSPDLVPIAIRIPRAVVCLISALAHHDLTTQVPHTVDLALPSHAQVPRIDGIPLRELSLSELRGEIGYVPQESFLFSDTIASNLAYGDETHSLMERAAEGETLAAESRATGEQDAESHAWAADVAQLAETVHEFPFGYGTMLGERGINLSGGQ